MIFLYRCPLPDTVPTYSQDEPTWIVVGRWAHIWNETTRNWFVLIPAPKPIDLLNRDKTMMFSIPRKVFMNHVPKRVRLEIVEDIIGIRLCSVAQFIRKHVRCLRRIRWLKELSELDAQQDFSDFVLNSEPPDFNMGSRKL